MAFSPDSIALFQRQTCFAANDLPMSAFFHGRRRKSVCSFGRNNLSLQYLPRHSIPGFAGNRHDKASAIHRIGIAPANSVS
jgi:hypothetical protein